MNEEEQLGGTPPELTEEERAFLLGGAVPGQASAVIEEVQADPQATVEEPQETSPTQDKYGWGTDTNRSIRDVRIGGELEGFANDPRTSAEYAAAIPTSLVDFGADFLNMVPGVHVPKIPKFQDEVTQTVREVSSIVLPTMMGQAAALGQIGKLSKGSKFLNDPLVKWLGTTMLAGGIGATVDYAVEFNQEDHNASGMLKKTFPRWFGWISDDIATLDSDSPDVKRAKNVTEGAYLGVGTDVILGLTKWARGLRGMDKATRIVPENEKATKWLKDNIEIDLTPEAAVERSAAKRSTELDELGSYNLDKQVDPNEPVYGYHDLFGFQEMGVRSVDDFGIVGASVDYARIAGDVDTVDGRVGSVMSEGAIKFGIEATENQELIIRGMSETLKDVGKYGYETAGGKYLNHAQIMKRGDDLAADFYDMNVGELETYIKQFQGKDVDTGVDVLNSEAYAGAVKAIKMYMDDFMDMDYMRAQAYVGTSLAGQISDTAQGMRLTAETPAIVRAQEQILDRVEFLMAQKGMTSYSRGRALNMLNLWNRMTVKGSKAFDLAEAKRLDNLIKNEKNTTLNTMERIKQETKRTVDNLREISTTNPEMLAPLMMAYELTDGNVKTITALNKYVKSSTGVLRKAFIDGDPEVPSVIMNGFFANVYNSTLSALKTPVKAGISGAHLLIEKPLRTFAGALPIVNGTLKTDMDAMRRGWYQYNNIVGALQESTQYMNQVFKKSALDPTVVAARDNISANQLRTVKQLEILEAFAEGKAASGDYGPQILMEQIRTMNDLANHPSLRFGTRSMQAFDGFTQSFTAHITAKGDAFDQITKGGTVPFDAKGADELADKVYKSMFDENGLITDKSVQIAAGEISLNLDTPANKALSDVIRKLPVLKPFMLFTKTPLNELQLASTYTPLGNFVRGLNDFALPFEDMPFEKVEQLLTTRGIEVTPYNIKNKYNEIRNDHAGRRAIGTGLTFATVGLITSDRIRGNGHYNRQKQKLRREAGWQPRTIKGFDGKWYSYDGLGPVTFWLSLVADIGDNFDSLSPNDIGEQLKKLSFITAASVTERTALAGIQPFLDVVRGDAGAINKWSSSFLTSATVRGSSQMAELSRLMMPELKLVENDLKDLVMNRNVLTKGMLPDEYDWIDGGKVGIPDSFLARIMNTYTPWNITGEISDEKQFLLDIEYDATPTLTTNGEGVKLSNEEQSEITRIMGEHGLFKEGIQRVMKSYNGKEFRRSYMEAINSRHDLNPDLSKFRNLHSQLDKQLRWAMKSAKARSKYLDDIQRRQYVQQTVGEYLRSGDQESAEAFLDYMEKDFSI